MQCCMAMRGRCSKCRRPKFPGNWFTWGAIGVFERFPNLKLALLRGGSYVPYHLGRLDQGMTGASGSSSIPAKQPPSKYLKNLCFDDLVYRVETVEYLKRMVGTDYTFDLGDWMAAEEIQTMNCTESEREAMMHGNARKLLRL